MTTICVDVMGSDKEPSVLLEGVAMALERDPELKVLVAGDASVVEPFARDHERASALATTEVIAMDEHPATAVRKKKDASIVRAAAAVRAGQADGLFSAGSTGAVLTAATFGIGRIKGKGTIYNPTDMDRMKANLDTEVDLRDPSVLNKMLGLDDVKLQPMKLSGKINKEGCKWVARNLRVSTGGGTLRGDGYYDVCNENYDVDAAFNNFPVKSFLPKYDVRNLTGSVNARGHGFDFTDCGSTWTDATVNLASVRYNGTHYGNIKARGRLRGGYADVYASSANKGCDLDMNAHGTICDDHYVFTADGNVRDLDLKHLGLYDGICNGKTRLHADGDINLRTQVWDADLTLHDIDWQLDSSLLVADDAHATLHSTPSITCITIENEDNYAHLNAPSAMMPLIEDFRQTAAVFQQQFKERYIDIERLKAPMPRFDFDMHMGADGLVQRYLQQYEFDFRNISCEMSRDSSIYIDGRAHGISYGETNVDTIISIIMEIVKKQHN